MTNLTESKTNINQRLTNIAWALFLIMVGGLWLMPNEFIPAGSWIVGVGLILLGLNVARHYYGIPICIGTVIIGLAALTCGLGFFLGVGLPLLPILFIFFGLSLLVNGRFTLKNNKSNPEV